MFCWKTTVHGLAFKRAIDSIAPLLLEGRVVCDKKQGLNLCGIGDRLSVHYHVDFEGDEVSGTEDQVIFVLDLKETSAWLQVFRSGMTLEVILDSKGLRLLFNNESKTFEHVTKLSNLRLPTDFVAPLQVKTACDVLLDISSPALAAVVKHHSKSSTHCSVVFDNDSKKVTLKSVLRAVDPVKKSETSLAGAIMLSELATPAYYVRQPLVATNDVDGEIYPLDLIKNVVKAYGFHDKKRGRVVVAIDHHSNKMTFIFKNELSSWLAFDILGAEDIEKTEKDEAAEDSDATVILDSPKMSIKRKKKKQKTTQVADLASAE